MRGYRDAKFREPCPFPGLARRMVNLEYIEGCNKVGPPIRERVQTGSENDVLANAASDGAVEFILGIATSQGENGAHAWKLDHFYRSDRLQHLGIAGVAGERAGEWVNEDLWVFIEQEVGSTMYSRPNRGAAWTILFH